VHRNTRLAAFARRTRVADWGVHIGVFVLCAMLYATGFDRLPPGLWTTVLRLVLFQVIWYPAAYLLNDYVDIEDDRAKAPDRASEVRRPSLWLILLLFLGGTVWAWGASHTAGLVCVAVTAAAAFAYSVPPLRLKLRGFAGVVTAALGQRLPFFLWLCVSHPVRVMPAVLLTAYLACVGMLFILHHQVEDLEVDRATAVMTWGVRKGRVYIHRVLLVNRAVLVGLAGLAWLLAWGGSPPGEMPLRFALGYTGLVLVTLLLFRLRHGARPHPLALIRTPRPARDTRRGGPGLRGSDDRR